MSTAAIAPMIPTIPTIPTRADLAEHALLVSVLHAWRRELHEISQPLTRLQCRLELGKLADAPVVTHRETVEGALADMVEVFASIQYLRKQLSDTEEMLIMREEA